MSFNKTGYEVIKQFIEKDFVEFIQDYLSLKINSGNVSLDDPQAKGNYTWYGEPLIETILQNACEPIGDIIGVKIVPTYCFTRLYNKGDILKKHVDRPSCEISATLSLGYSNDSGPNPICFSNNINATDSIEIYLEPGDLCVYKGCDMYHWRPPIQNTWLLQSFLHFVDGEGQHKNFIYDKRPYLGFPKQSG